MNIFGFVFVLWCVYGLSVTVRHHLSHLDTVRAVQMVEDGLSQRRVARILGVSPSVVNRLWNRYVDTGSHQRRPGQGRPRATTAVQDRYLRTLSLRNRLSTARSLRNDFQMATGVRLCNQTVRNRLHSDSLRARRPATGPILTPDHRRRRLDFANEHARWTLPQWHCVLFTDESRFHVSSCDRRVRVWRREGERYADCNIVQHDRFGGGSIMFWGGICYG